MTYSTTHQILSTYTIGMAMILIVFFSTELQNNSFRFNIKVPSGTVIVTLRFVTKYLGNHDIWVISGHKKI